MGSTGHSLQKNREGAINDTTFGIANAVNFTGKLPTDTNLEPLGPNKVTLKIASSDRRDILFQFKLTKDSRFMVITAHDPNSPPVKAKVNVESGTPSLDEVIATGNNSQASNAIKIKDMMSKSTKIDENQLGAIANKLLKNKEKK